MPQCFKCGIDAKYGIAGGWNCTNVKIDGSTFYCTRCWTYWERHVQSGQTYSLSKAIEELAIRVGIQFINPLEKSHHGNPFYCPPCQMFFNAGPQSIERHLLQSHGDQQPVARKRKLDDAAVTKKEITEPVLYVSGCRNADTFSHMLRGQYTAKRWHHGKPVYEKEALFGCDRPVVLYFWDDQWGEKYHGWWFSPREGSSEVLAYNSSNLDPDDLTVPKSGWKVPFDGDVDTTLNITTDRIASVHGDNAPFELRWEFDASAHGEQQDWQPMKKEMNDALEKRWLDGWTGDKGSHDFRIQCNGFTYIHY